MVAQLIIRASLEREESRGLHFTLDHSDLSKKPSDTVLILGKNAELLGNKVMSQTF